MSHLRITITLFVLLVATGITHAAANNVSFEQGMGFDHARRLPEAVAAFKKSALAQPAAGTLVNLGIAEWQCGHAGEAILAWEQARWIDPFDSRAKSNLKFARAAAKVDEPQLKWFEVASLWLPPDAWVWLAGTSLCLTVGALTLPRFFRWRKTGWQQALAAVGLGIFLTSMTTNIGVVSRTTLGFVLKRNAPLLLTPTHTGEMISTLNAGESARWLRTRGDYNLIRTANGAGWIARDEFGLVNK